MRTTSPVVDAFGMQVLVVSCTDDHIRWSPIEVHDDYRLVFVHGGRFSRWSDGVATYLDRTCAYLSTPGEEERFAHPTGGDRCVALRVVPERWRALTDRRPADGGSFVYVGDQVDLAHRRLLAAAGSGDVTYGVVEAVAELARAATEQFADMVETDARLPGPVCRAVVRQARDAILAGDPAAGSLVSLATALHVSPSQLSRQFSREMKMSLTRFRNRVRVGLALRRLADGEENLAVLSSDLGFADQAHLTRTVREHAGHTPATIRRLLAGVRGGHRKPVVAGCGQDS